MKVSLRFCVFLYCVVEVLSQTTQNIEAIREKQKKRIEISRAMRSCIFENKVTYTLAVQYGKGDFKDESDKGKCFLRCFAVKMKLFDAETGNPQKEELLNYSSYLSAEDLPFNEIIDTCDQTTEKSENQCDFVFRMYKCLWNGIKNSPEPESLRDSFNDVFGFNQLFDEAEIKAELEAETEGVVEDEVDNDKEVQEVHVKE
ncbi:uncharacterized protein [Chironomus tepperi]|uniref:uncharacterized protein n=1 Tax=Chironomus tepperi TaxID=113505 RepID=UPI00391F3349